ncbi:homoprotocatechuate degradation operon regulator HpaR [Paracoccaceae bacterium Fryx2]|nr:homoprotocatechuate degradation operon regulator HpaR [Paracoccaceae bacterium Fryx2]
MAPDSDAILPRNTRQSLPMALLRAREAVMARFRPLLDAADINEQQWRVIRVLAESGRLDATELSARANILAPSLTRMIRAMTDRGLITRHADSKDRRRVMLENTEMATALIRAVSPHSLQIYRGLERDFGPDRMATLLALLNDLAALAPPDERRP